jgi:large subunit ribosomal protein L3
VLTGFEALQLGFDDKTRTFHKSGLGHFKKAGTVAKKKSLNFRILQQNKN